MTRSSRIRRREFVQAGVLGLGGLTWADALRLARAGEGGDAPAPAADAVLFVNLAGGVSHLDSLDMKPEAPAETRGEFASISTSIPGLAVCEHLPRLAENLHRYCLIRGISHSAGDHPQGQQYIATGNRPVRALVHPSIGSIVSKEFPGTAEVPSYVAVPATEWTAGYLGDAYAPFKTNAVPEPGKPFLVRGIALSEGLTVETVNRRQELLRKVDQRFRQMEMQSRLLEALDEFSQRAHRMILSDRARQAFDVSGEPESVRQRFTADEFDQSMVLGCRLIEFGVPFVTVTFGGWDTHTDNFPQHRTLLGRLDRGLAAALATLDDKGLLERTLVVVMGEFGRTPKINENAGRDHWPRVNWSLMIGGGTAAGRLVGGTDRAGAAPADGVEIVPDDLVATIYHAIGIDFHKEYMTQTGRPVHLVPHGRVLREVFA